MDFLSLVVMATSLVSWKWMESVDKVRWMLIPTRVHRHQEWWRLLSHGFVHADWMHLAMNMFVLYEFGRTVQTDLGFLGLAGLPGLYVFSLVAGSLPALAKHKNNSSYRSLGASGAVSAVLVSYIVLHPTHTLLLFFVVPIPAALAGVLFFWYESRMATKSGTRVAHDAHMAGGFAGLLWTIYWVPQSLMRCWDQLANSFQSLTIL
jgi:membrane associated rhomboid family serine protease